MSKMPSESKPLLTAQTEKPNHYKYLKEFRVEQCPSFLQHKCTQHRPFTCFHWHFNNQRRRRPVRKRDGSFNYSADNYCTKYNETSGICEDGDDCPYLHRTAGDTERRYHLRYYKTCMCVHDTDARGLCTKNGAHCAFAHGAPDLRPPVLDVRELQALENPDGNDVDAMPNALDRERNLLNEDPKWQDTNIVLSSYKTEPCKRPPRLCRQGYACPQYHNSKDKRRSPRKYKYRSTPCPNVKHGEEWGEPSNCEAGDACAYCHTRTEQQFHPEIYKSTKCNDVQQAGYCPRGLFCAFAHVEPEELTANRVVCPIESGTPLSELLTSALGSPPAPLAAPLPALPPSPPPRSPPPQPATNGASSRASSSSGASNTGVWARTSFETNVLDVVGNALDEISLEDPLRLVAALDRDLEPSNPQSQRYSPDRPFLRYAEYSQVSTPRFEFGSPPVARMAVWDERMGAARQACLVWQRETEEANRKVVLAERQRDEAVALAVGLKRELDQARARPRDLRGLPLSTLKTMQAVARRELEDIDKAMYLEMATKCMVCEENPRTVTLAPCNHYVLCDNCAATASECPYCQTPTAQH